MTARRTDPPADPRVVEFLVRAAREFRRGGYVFAGFHWPVLAGQLASALPGAPFTQVFEAGATAHGPADPLPTSTTDYPAYAGVTGYRGSTAEVLFTMVRRCDRVVLDAANVDLAGRVNATAVGDYHRPRVRLAGGGGAADAAAGARELVLLHGGADPRRLHQRVEHVTAAPADGVPVRLHTRWGMLTLGGGLARPVLRYRATDADRDGFLDHLAGLGVDVASASPAPPVTAAERDAAQQLLVAAADRGYRVARAALATPEQTGAAAAPTRAEEETRG